MTKAAKKVGQKSKTIGDELWSKQTAAERQVAQLAAFNKSLIKNAKLTMTELLAAVATKDGEIAELKRQVSISPYDSDQIEVINELGAKCLRLEEALKTATIREQSLLDTIKQQDDMLVESRADLNRMKDERDNAFTTIMAGKSIPRLRSKARVQMLKAELDETRKALVQMVDMLHSCHEEGNRT